MAYPDLYDLTYSYTHFQQSQGDNSFPGTQLDSDLDGLKDAITNVANFSKLAIRADGQLINGLVTYDSLSPSLQVAGLAPADDWVTATAYAVGAVVIQSANVYRATASHTSGVFAADLGAGKWQFRFALVAGPQGPKGEPGTGSGDVVAANNGSDFANKKATKDNLSVLGADIISAATINLETATGDVVDVTGTMTITAITLSDGHERTVRFTGALILMNGASLVLPGGQNIATVAGAFAVFRGYASGVVRCVSYTPGAGVVGVDPQLITTAQQTQVLTNVGAAPLILPRTSNYTVGAGDRGKMISASIAQGSTLTLGSLAASTAGAGFEFYVENTSYGSVIFDPNGSETVDGDASIPIFKGQSFAIVSDGANWKTRGKQSVFTIEVKKAISNVANAAFLIPDGLKLMELNIGGLYGSAATVTLAIRTSTDGGASFNAAANYVGNIMYAASGGTTASSYSASLTSLQLSGAVGPASAGGYNLIADLRISRQASGGFGLGGITSHFNSAAAYHQVNQVGGYYNAAGVVNAMAVFVVGGNLYADEIILIGRDK